MSIELIRRLRQLGTLLFILMWVPFICIFAGMASEYGQFGQQLVRRFPLLLGINESGASTLTEVSFVLTFGLMCVSMSLTFGAPMLAGMANRRIRQAGQRASARIISAEQTGTYINENPEVRFSLEVQPATGSSFYADAEMVVPLVKLAQYQPGADVTVRYNPTTLEVAISDEPLI